MPLTRKMQKDVDEVLKIQNCKALGKMEEEDYIDLILNEVLSRDKSYNQEPSRQQIREYIIQQVRDEEAEDLSIVDARKSAYNSKIGYRIPGNTEIVAAKVMGGQAQILRTDGKQSYLSPTKSDAAINSLDGIIPLTPLKGDMEFYIKQPVDLQERAMSASGPLPQSKVPPPANELLKITECTIDKKVLKKWSGIQRKTRDNQKKVMNNTTAWEYVRGMPIAGANPLKHNGTNKRKNYGWEWLHLIAFSMGGPNNKDADSTNPQVQENLVAGTYAANTWMLHLEEAIKAFVDKFNISITIKVTAFLIRESHVAEKLVYDLNFNNINGQNTSASFEFDLFTHTHPPHPAKHVADVLGLKYADRYRYEKK